MNTLQSLPSLENNGSPLNMVYYAKSLGFLIDENLKWINHIDAISKKISSCIGSINRVRHCLRPGTLLNIYHDSVKSHFDYYSVLWASCGKELSDK